MGIGGRQCILVIEDELRIRELIDEALRPLYEVRLAGSGSEGLASAQAQGADLILLDLRMPELDGMAVLAQLKAHAATRRIPVVIVSADGETKTVMAGQREGAVDHLIKPFAIAELRQVVRRQLLDRQEPGARA